MKHVFGLPEPLARMSPVHIPRGFTQALHRRPGRRGPAGAHPRRPRVVRRRPRHAAHRGHRAMPGSGRSSACRTRSSRGCSARRRSSSRRAASAGRSTRSCSTPRCSSARASMSPGPSSTRSTCWRKPDLARTLERGLARHGIPLLGVLPYRPILSNPTLAMVLEGVHGETIHPGPDLDQVIGGVAIGAMEPEHMLQRIGPRALVIVPGDREDVIAAIVHARRIGSDGRRRRARPRADRRLPTAARRSSTRSARPTCSRRSSTRTPTRSPPRSTTCWSRRTSPTRGKIEEIKALVWEYLFIDRISEVATEAPLGRRELVAATATWRGPGPRPAPRSLSRWRAAARPRGTHASSRRGDGAAGAATAPSAASTSAGMARAATGRAGDGRATRAATASGRGRGRIGRDVERAAPPVRAVTTATEHLADELEAAGRSAGRPGPRTTRPAQADRHAIRARCRRAARRSRP